MRLTFAGPHVSITSLPTVELPKFTVLTGLNGAGKSHLLEALENGKVAVDIAAPGEVRRYDWNSFVRPDVAAVDANDTRRERLAVRDSVLPHVQQNNQVYQAASNFEISLNGIASAVELLALNEQKLAGRMPPQPKAPAAEVLAALAIARGADEQNFRSTPQFRGQVPYLEALARVVKKTRLVDLVAEDFENDTLLSTNAAQDPIQASFARLFVDYRGLKLTNDLKQNAQAKGQPADGVLTDEEFVERHMPPPWDFLNEAMAEAKLPFTVDHPDLYSLASYTPQLHKTGRKGEIPFAKLSSGEKVLMSLACILYFARDTRQSSKFPKLLLLDEIDAPLHPKMTRQLLSIIQHTLVETSDVHVILTTHSPSTVALAPEDSICLMSADGPQLRKATQSEALNLLTEGVPTLSLSCDGRRQVFVESPADVQVYTVLYDVLRPQLNSERSLQFLATGTKTIKSPSSNKEGSTESKASASDENTGSDNVRRIVSDLVTAGNQSAFGLIDGDGKHQPAPRIQVVAQGKRDGLENCLFDPLVVLMLITRHVRQYMGELDIPEKLTDRQLAQLPDEVLQPMIENLENFVLGTPQATAVRHQVEYNDGLILRLREDYLRYDDHDLEKLLFVTKMPGLNKISNNHPGSRMTYVVDVVLRAYPEFIPKDVVDSLRLLLEAPMHTGQPDVVVDERSVNTCEENLTE
jgi:predicted ATPase